MGSMKKGVLFSLLSLLLVILLVSLSAILPEKVDFFQEQKTEIFLSQRDAFYHTIIGRNILDIQGFSIPSIQNSKVFFENYGYLDGISESTILSQYESFIETNFSTESNTQIRLDSDETEFYITPLDIITSVSASEIETDFSTGLLKGIDMHIYVLVDNSEYIGDSSPSDSGDSAHPWVNISVYDNSSTLVTSYSVKLDPDLSNADFDIDFSSVGMTINYGDSSKLLINTNDTIDIRDVTFEFDSVDYAYSYSNATVQINNILRQLTLR